jgi:signal transduction histidine kinase
MSEADEANPGGPAGAVGPVAGHWTRDWLGWFLAAAVVVSLIGFYNLGRDLNRPFAGFAAFNRALQSHSEIDANSPAWWPAMLDDALRYGDVLLTIDGRPFYPEAREAIEAAAAAGRSSVSVALTREGEEGVVVKPVPVVTFDLAYFIDLRLPDLITAVSYWLLALLVYQSQPKDRASRAFVIMAGLLAVSRALYVHSVHYDGSQLTTAVESTLQAILPFIGVVALYFVLEYPVRYEGRPLRFLLFAMALVASLTAVILVLSRVPAVAEPTRVRFDDVGSTLVLLLYGLGIALAFGRLAWLWRQARKTGDKRGEHILRILVLSATLALPILVSSALTQLIPPDLARYFPYNLDLRYLLLFIPMGFAWVLIRYHALQSPSRAYYFVVILCTSALIAAVGDVIWIMSHDGWPESGQRPPFIALFVSAFVASLLWSRLAGYEGRFSRLVPYQRRRSMTNATLRVGRAIMGEGDAASLPERIARSVRTELASEAVAVWVRDLEDDCLRLQGFDSEVAHENLRQELPLELRGPAPASAVPRTIRLKGPVPPPDYLAGLAAVDRLEVAVPLQTAEGRVGLMAIARRWDERVFDDRDLEVHELLGQQVTLALVAARQVDELRRVPVRLAEAQEQQRTAIAGELHDTVQQFLGRLPFYLAIARDSLRKDPNMAVEVLNQIVDDAARSAADLRDIRNSLAPSQLDVGLSRSLTSLAGYYERRRLFDVDLALSEGLDEATTIATRHALFRAIQQALDNVQVHSEATAVALNVMRENGRVTFSVADNGRGFSEAERMAAQASGSFGLRSMRARLEAVGGGFSFESRPGAGTTVHGWVPAAEDGPQTAV